MTDPRHCKIDYIEIPTPDVGASRRFFERLFGWEFQDYGPDYVSFNDGGTAGGFHTSDKAPATESGSVLVVFFAERLDDALASVTECGGTVTKDIFEFPGGRRFHFRDPAGAEFAIWSDDMLNQTDQTDGA